MSRIEVLSVTDLGPSLRAADLRVVVRAVDEKGTRDVLDWQPIVVLR